MKRPAEPGPGRESEATGLPGFDTWRGVYLVVLGGFVLWVVLLYWLGVAFG